MWQVCSGCFYLSVIYRSLGDLYDLDQNGGIAIRPVANVLLDVFFEAVLDERWNPECEMDWVNDLQAQWTLGLHPFQQHAEEEVRKKYKRLALSAHPDKPGGSEYQMEKLNVALNTYGLCRFRNGASGSRRGH